MSHPPHPSRPQPRFYLPTTTSPSLPSRSRRQSTANAFSLPTSPRSRRESLAALPSALQSYHVPGPYEPRPVTESMSKLELSTPEGLGAERMDALVEIHRVLYRGKEDLRWEGRSLGWVAQGREVKRVIHRWFEGDCVYDHPLARISTRQSLLSHFILLHLLSTLYLPSLTPGALLHHARAMTSHLRNKLVGLDDVEAGKGREVEDEWLGEERNGDELQMEGWWRVWDVEADCKEIGGMECYDGCHLAMIEHVITLTLFPSLAQHRLLTSFHPSSPSSSSSISSFPSLDIPSNSFPRRLVASFLLEFDSLFHWDLPISTMVEFNEVGKATHMRDVIDVRDMVETFVPFARRFGWLTRRVTGLVSSTLGAVAMALVPGPRVHVGSPIRIEAAAKGKWREESLVEKQGPHGLGSAIDLELDVPQRPREHSNESESNSLGLAGVESAMAPDVDDEVVDT